MQRTLRLSRWSKELEIPRNGILILRHGPRHKIVSKGTIETANLTDDGRKECTEFGKLFHHQAQFISSPVRRCVETAELMSQRKNEDIETNSLLGSPGPFIVDFQAWNQQWKNSEQPIKTMMDLLRQHIEGKEISGLLNRDEGVENLIRFLLQKKRERLMIAISHDSIIQAILKANDIAGSWPKFLHGVLISIEE